MRLVSESAVLARKGDGVLLVLDAEETGKRTLRQAVRVLDGVGARMIGTVTNRAPGETAVYGYGYYGGT